MRGIYVIEIGVAMARPPKIDQYRIYTIVADTWMDAENTACQMAACTSVMPVYSQIIEWPEN